MDRYNAFESPDAATWLEQDDQERVEVVLQYHRRTREGLPDARLHALIHVVVENQIAVGEELPVRATVARLMDEGLDRHDAIHAVGSLLAGAMFDLVKGGTGSRDPDQEYLMNLQGLSATEWRKAR